MEWIEAWGRKVALHRYDAIIIGSGCAGLNAADTLHGLGYTNIALVTEGMNMGTSRNTGSDKQTYYKLAWQTGEADNVRKMAETLFSGRSVHGDLAFSEAANSIRCFMKLVNLGVPFPTNAYGEYVGYQTDHSTEKRATSAGPLTSKYMTEALEQEVRCRNIAVLDHMVIVELVRNDDGIIGAIGLNQEEIAHGESGLHLFLTGNVVLATGGPASIYQNRVYPASQTGMTALAIQVGARCENLQEWQYGLASVDFRWNLSGTYQQVLPRYVSVDEAGVEREFLYNYFDDPMEAMNMVFLKGYQWPFDSAKINGSTVIDMIVYNEEVNLGRTVYLDYCSDPAALKVGLENLSNEAYDYLKNSGALVATPIARLEKMNPKAIELYRSHGIDLHSQMLRITVSAQHCNGGVAVDADWQSSIPGLYAVGEAAATFGVSRPGGTALNSTQVGSLRAAEHIVRTGRKTQATENDCIAYAPLVMEFLKQNNAHGDDQEGCYERLKNIEKRVASDMSAYGAQLRDVKNLRLLKVKIADSLTELSEISKMISVKDMVVWFKVQNTLVTADAVIDAILFSAEHIGTRGGSACCDKPVDFSSAASIMRLPIRKNESYDDQVLCYQKEAGCSFEPVRPLPETELWFETVWEKYRAREKQKHSHAGC